MKTIFFVWFFLPFSLYALSLDEILSMDRASIKAYIKERERRLFIETVCEKQKQRGKLATACFELPPLEAKKKGGAWRGKNNRNNNRGNNREENYNGKNSKQNIENREEAEAFCLSARTKGLNFKQLEELLKLKHLSLACRKHLLGLKKILFYRKKDFLLPELKKYWTGQKGLL